MKQILFTLVALVFSLEPSAQAMEKPSFHTQGTPTGKPTGPLKPSEYWWAPHVSPNGPVIVLVSLPQQIMNVYRNGILVGRSSISSGSKDHPTPPGVFTILEKNRSHRSKTYDNAPMPHMQRLTWCGVAFHSGHLPGYAASHGCIRLPYDFSKLLFDLTQTGGTVVVSDGKNPHPYFASNPGIVLSNKDSSQSAAKSLGKNDYEWNPQHSTTGPITVLISGSDRILYVTRNGVRIGRASLQIRGVGKLGDQVFTLLDGTTGGGSLWAPNRTAHRWMSMTTGSGRKTGIEALHKRIVLNPEFAVKLHDALTPGATLVITDQAAERKPLNDVTFGR